LVRGAILPAQFDLAQRVSSRTALIADSQSVGISRQSGLDANAFAKNTIRSYPSVDQSPIVTDLIAWTTDRLDEVQIFVPAYLAKHDVSDRESGTINRRYSAELA
jgi:hypothetical protein